MRNNRFFVLLSCLLASACASQQQYDPDRDSGAMWVKHAVEYRAVASQAYAAASNDLQRFVADKSWSAMPDYPVDETLPPAVILDIDETIVSNVDFQMSYERPYNNEKRDAWSQDNDSLAVPGVVEFVRNARAAGVEVFFVTNRPCEARDNNPDPCPQFQTAIDDLNEIGIEVPTNRLMLSGLEPEWDREKLVRRKLIARSYRIIMLIGDDLGDFIPCSRTRLTKTCDAPATSESRLRDYEQHRHYWGNGWYILPNPMHGSWTSVL